MWRCAAGTALVAFASAGGATADHTRWETMLPLLEPHATVHAMDRRGRGGSGDSPSAPQLVVDLILGFTHEGGL